MGAMALAAAETETAQTHGGAPALPRPASTGGWTVDDLAALPDNGMRYEIIDGVLLVSPSPALPHQRASMRLGNLLAARCLDGLEVFAAPLDWQPASDRSFEPDLLVVRRDDATGTKLDGLPVLLVEILSPSTARIDRTLKFSAYADADVAQYWLVDPGSATTPPSVSVYDLHDGTYKLQGSATGEETLAVAGPVAVTITPAALVR